MINLTEHHRKKFFNIPLYYDRRIQKSLHKNTFMRKTFWGFEALWKYVPRREFKHIQEE